MKRRWTHNIISGIRDIGIVAWVEQHFCVLGKDMYNANVESFVESSELCVVMIIKQTQYLAQKKRS